MKERKGGSVDRVQQQGLSERGRLRLWGVPLATRSSGNTDKHEWVKIWDGCLLERTSTDWAVLVGMTERDGGDLQESL